MGRITHGYAQMNSDGKSWFFLGNLQHAESIEGLVPGTYEFDPDTGKGRFTPTGNPKIKTGIITSFAGLDPEARNELRIKGELGVVEGMVEDRGAEVARRGGVSMASLDPEALEALRAETDARFSVVQTQVGAMGDKMDAMMAMLGKIAGSAGAPSSGEPLGDSDGGSASSSPANAPVARRVKAPTEAA